MKLSNNNVIDLNKIASDKIEVLGEFHQDLNVFQVKEGLLREKIRVLKRKRKGTDNESIKEGFTNQINALEKDLETVKILAK